MPRSIFNARLMINDLIIPVKLVSAVEPRAVSFRLLHANDRVPVRQRMVHPVTGEEVAHEDIQKGIALPHGMVVLRDEELAELEPADSRDLEVLRFVPTTQLDHQWYVRPYYLAPHGPDDTNDYFALARALAVERKQGIVRWTMRKKNYRGALRPVGDHLALITLRSALEVVATDALPELSWPTPSTQELNMAQQLVQMLEGELDLEQFQDHYAEQVVALARAKAEGRATPLPVPRPERQTTPSLADALAASIARLQEQDVA